MGNQLAASGAAATINVQDLSQNLSLVAPLGGAKRGRLFTSLHCKIPSSAAALSLSSNSTAVSSIEGVDVVVKVFLQKDGDKEQARLLQRHHETLSNMASRIVALSKNFRVAATPNNVLFYSVMEKSKTGYCLLQRPYVHYSLTERLQTRPYLEMPQRLFLCYQLLQALRHLHDDFGIAHGDVKAENILISSNNWLYLTDIAPYKPCPVPSFDPSNFDFYYDNAENRTCCMAPEKFFDVSSTMKIGWDHSVTSDIFSAACVMVHILSDDALFKLPGALEFRSIGETERRNLLRDVLAGRQVPVHAMDAISSMMCGRADERPTAREILLQHTTSPSGAEHSLKGMSTPSSATSQSMSDPSKLFPAYFPFVFFNVMTVLKRPPDAQLQFLFARWEHILETVDRCAVDPEYSWSMVPEEGQSLMSSSSTTASNQVRNRSNTAPVVAGGGLDRRLLDLSTSQPQTKIPLPKERHSVVVPSTQEDCNTEIGKQNKVPPLPEDANIMDIGKQNKVPIHAAYRQGVVSILAPLITSQIRHAKTVDSRARGLTLFQKLCPWASENTKRDVFLPTLLHFVKSQDYGSVARVAALRALVHVVESLPTFPVGECLVFEDLILPALTEAQRDTSLLFITEFARAVPRLLETAVRYIEKRQVLVGDHRWLNGFDFQLYQLVGIGWEMIKTLQGQPNSSVCVTWLQAVPTMIKVLGKEKSATELLPLLFTFMSNSAVEIKRELIRQVSVVALFVEDPPHQLIRITMEEGFKQNDVGVTVTTLEAVNKLTGGKHLPVALRIELVQRSIPFITSVNANIQGAAIEVVETAAKTLSSTDILLFLVEPLNTLLVKHVPLVHLSKYKSAIRKDLDFDDHHLNTNADRNHLVSCVDYTEMYLPSSIELLSNVNIRQTEDVECDLNHCDVGDANVQQRPTPGEPMVGNLSSSSFCEEGKSQWVMNDFAATNRQQKRINERNNFSNFAMVSSVFAPNYGALPAVCPVGLTMESPGTSPNHRGSIVIKKVTHAASGSFFNGSFVASNAPSRSAKIRDDGGDGLPRSALASFRPLAAAMATSSHEGAIYGMTYGGGWLVTAGDSGLVKLWELDCSANSNLLVPTPLTNINPDPAASSTDAVPQSSLVFLFAEFVKSNNYAQNIALGGTDGQLRLYDVTASKLSDCMNLGQSDSQVASTLSCCSILPALNLMLVGTYKGDIFCVDPRAKSSNGRVVWEARVKPQQGAITALQLLQGNDFNSPTSTSTCGFVCATNRGVLPLFDLRFRLLIKDINVGSSILSMCMDPTSATRQSPPNVMVSLANGGVMRYDLNSGKETLRLRIYDETSITRCLLHVPKSSFVITGGSDRLLRLWDFNNPPLSRVLVCHPQKSPTFILKRDPSLIQVTNTPPTTTTSKWSNPIVKTRKSMDAQQQRPLGVDPLLSKNVSNLSSSSASSTSAHPEICETFSSPPKGSYSVKEHHRDEISAVCVVSMRNAMHLVSAGRDGSLKLWHNAVTASSGDKAV